MCNYFIQKNCRDNEILRKSFNALAQKTFGLDFEEWYQNGYWRENYIPYSITDGNFILSNVSVNPMTFDDHGIKRRYIQLGTVMTEESHRHQGLCRLLMEEIFRDFGDADGIYLFANDSVLDFYPKFGFRKAREYQYTKSVNIDKEASSIPMPMKTKAERMILEQAIQNSVSCSAFEMKSNVGLIMFYITGFMKDCVYYIPPQNAYAVGEIEKATLTLHCVFSPKPIQLDEIIRAFGRDIRTVVLGFTPIDKEGYTKSQLQEEDTTLFVKGAAFDSFEQEEKMFPLLSHA